MQELYDRLCELEDRHDYIKNDIYDTRVAMQQQKRRTNPVEQRRHRPEADCLPERFRPAQTGNQ